MENCKTKRVDFIDLAKGIAILCMVWLHVGTIFPITDAIVHVFHMPIFFCVSGYLFNYKKDFLSFFKRKAFTLLVPYFLWGVILYIVWTLIYYIFKRYESIESIDTLILSLFYDNAEISPYACIQWFFTTLFFSNVFFFTVVYLSKGKKGFVVLISIIFGFVGSLFAYLPFRFPLGMDVAFMAVFFMGVGYLLKDLNLKKYMIPILILIIVVTFVYNKNCEWNMRCMSYGISVLYMIGSAAFCIIIFEFCKKVCSLISAKYIKPLLFCGKNSIWILIFNTFYINILKLLFETIHIFIPNWCLLLLVYLFLFPTIIICKKYFGWTIGIKKQKKQLLTN